MRVTPGQRLARLAALGLICSIAAWGVQFLPADDYQPSRPLYALGWLLASSIAFWIVRKRATPIRGASIMLVVIFAIALCIALLMR